jgi:hypothetical protein
VGHAPPIDADAFNAFEAAGWEGRVDAYDRFFTAITARLFDPLLDAAGVAPGTRLLDVATGPGHMPARAAERGAVPLGVDVAEAMVGRADELYPARRALDELCARLGSEASRTASTSPSRGPTTCCARVRRRGSGSCRSRRSRWGASPTHRLAWPAPPPGMGATPAQTALAWLLRRWLVVLPIPGTGSLEHSARTSARALLAPVSLMR